MPHRRRMVFQCLDSCPSPVVGLSLVLMMVLALSIAPSCSHKADRSPKPGTFFPLATGNTWVFYINGTSPDSALDSIWIKEDSVLTTDGRREHWYLLCCAHLLDRLIWIRSDSVGDLYYTEKKFGTTMPFLLPSRTGGESWFFRRFCFDVDTLCVSDTAALLFIPSGDFLFNARMISANAACRKGDWEIDLYRGIGPVCWRLGSTTWGLLRWRVADSTETSAIVADGYLLNPE